jgi:hypothetical protein
MPCCGLYFLYACMTYGLLYNGLDELVGRIHGNNGSIHGH